LFKLQLQSINSKQIYSNHIADEIDGVIFDISNTISELSPPNKFSSLRR
jgi:hypothetical protein